MSVTRIWDADNNTWQFVGAGPIAPSQGYLPGNPVYYTASGNFVKADYPGMVAVLVECQGGGGSGGSSSTCGAAGWSAGTGGGGGYYARSIVPVSDLDITEAVTVGAGAAKVAVAGANGLNGGDSIFDTISGEVRAKGGPLGSGHGQETGAWTFSLGPVSQQAGSVGQLLIPGGPGRMGYRANSSAWVSAGGGGGSSFLSAESMFHNVNAEGHNGVLYGGGGGGGASSGNQSAWAGGNGANGIVIVTPLYSTDGSGGTGPRGVLGYAEQAANQGFAGSTPITGLTLHDHCPGQPSNQDQWPGQIADQRCTGSRQCSDPAERCSDCTN